MDENQIENRGYSWVVQSVKTNGTLDTIFNSVPPRKTSREEGSARCCGGRPCRVLNRLHRGQGGNIALRQVAQWPPGLCVERDRMAIRCVL
jgi:hypothetical protein